MKRTNILLKPIILVAAMVTLLGGFASEARAVTYTVDTTSDNSSLNACTTNPGDCSLRGAIARANSNSIKGTVIKFALPPYDGRFPNGSTERGTCTIVLTNGALLFNPSYYLETEWVINL